MNHDRNTIWAGLFKARLIKLTQDKREFWLEFCNFSVRFSVYKQLCDIQNNQGRGKGYQPKPKAEVDNPYRNFGYSGYHRNRNLIIVLIYIERKNLEVMFLLLDGKQQESREVDMITLRNHALRSYMTW